MNRITKQYARLYETSLKSRETDKFWDDVDTDMDKGNVTGSDFSIQGLFEEFIRDEHGDPCGREIMSSWVPDGGLTVQHVEEAGMGATTTAAFTRITGQIVYNEILEAFQNPDFIADRLAKTVPTAFLDGERIAGISNVGDDAEDLSETMPYPLTGITQAYIDTPRPVKRGHILPLTREVIISDRTQVLLDRAASIGTTMGMNKEKRVVDTAIGVTTTWKRNGSAATGTYGNDSGVHSFDNLIVNDLVDYTDIDVMLQQFDGFTDPETGEPIVTQSTQLLVAAGRLFTARRIVNATSIEQGAIAAGVPRTLGPNPLINPSHGGAGASSPFEILTSPYVQVRMTAGSVTADTWWGGNFQRAFRYMQVWPMTTDQLPSNSMWEFQNDIVRAWKVSEFGVVAVLEPRHVMQNDPA